jgi:hypothetical protein
MRAKTIIRKKEKKKPKREKKGRNIRERKRKKTDICMLELIIILLSYLVLDVVSQL